MESRSCSSIEVKVMSCNDLKAFNFFQKLFVYAVVSIVKEGNNNNNNNNNKKEKEQQQQQRTPIDIEGDGNPVWNHTMRFDLKGDELILDDCDGVFIEFNLRCEAIVFGDKTIGEVRVPIKDLMQEEDEPSNSNGTVRFVSYQVRSPDRKPNGVLHLSCKIIHSDDGKIWGNTASPSLAYHPHGPQTPAGLETHYPCVEVEPPSLSGVNYPSVELEPLPPLSLAPPLEEGYYSAPEFYYTVPPTPPPLGPCYPPPPPPSRPLVYHAPPVPLEGGYYSAPEFYYTVPPTPPPLGPYYPPPPPSPPLVYHAPPVPFGYGLESYGYGWHNHSAIQTTNTGQWGKPGDYMR